MIRRLVLVVGFVPAILLAGAWWIISGKPAVKMMDAFEDWGTRRNG